MPANRSELQAARDADRLGGAGLLFNGLSQAAIWTAIHEQDWTPVLAEKLALADQAISTKSPPAIW